MAAPTKGRAERRVRLTRDRVLGTAIELADTGGIDALTMRRLGDELGVEAMSLYNHVSNKDDLLNGMIDAVFAEIDLAADATDWKSAMRKRAISLRETLTRHPWATGLMDSGTTPGHFTMRHHDSVIGTLRSGGFSLALTAHAFSVLDSYIYGFAMQETSLPFDTPEETAAMATMMFAHLPADEFPNLAEFTRDHVLQPGYNYADEYEFGLDLILDGLQMARDRDAT